MANISRYPQSHYSKYAQVHLNETETKRIEYVQQLRAYFDKVEPNIHLTDDDGILIAFLRVCKYNMDLTIKKVRNYYIIRGQMPSVFAQRDPELARMKKLLSLGVIVPLRKFHDDRLVIIARVSSYDPREFHITEIFKVYYMILDVCSRICPQVQVFGVCYLMDMQGVSLRHLKDLTPSMIRLVVSTWENYHCRPKQLEFISVPRFFHIVLDICRRFMSNKLKQRLRVHNNGIDSYHKLVDKSILPLEYGGDDGPIEDHIRFWSEEVTRHKAWMLHDEQFVADHC